MLRSASLSVALFGLITLLSAPVFAEVQTPAAPAPVAEAPEAPKVETPKMEAPKAEPSKMEVAKPADKAADDKSAAKRRDRYKKMSPEQKDEMRKKAEHRMGERFDRLKTAEQESIKNILAEINKLSKEQRSILNAKIKQQSRTQAMQRKAMKDMEKNKTETNKKEAPAIDPNVAKH